MTNGNNGNGKKPTVDQRRAMAALAEEIFTKKIEAARDQEGDLTRDITEDIRKELGVDALDHNIDTLESQKKILEDKKKKLGWGYGGFIESSKTNRLLKGRVAKQSSGLKKLEAARQQSLTSIWTCDTVEELEDLVGSL